MSSNATDAAPASSAPASGPAKDDAQTTSRDPSPEEAEEGEIDESSEYPPTDEERPGSSGAKTATGKKEGADPSAKPEEDKSVLPAAAAPDAPPPLPSEPVPQAEDDGWEPHWNPNDSNWWFYNRFTGVWQQENPRVPQPTAGPNPAAAPIPPQHPTAATHGAEKASGAAAADADAAAATATAAAAALSKPDSVAGGYNPAIHGSYDENAWYAKNTKAQQNAAGEEGADGLLGGGSGSGSDQLELDNAPGGAYFNRTTGEWQAADEGPERHTDEARSRRQMNAFFDVDAAANQHDGRSLRAERSGKKPSRSELKAFKQKRKAKKEEKRRAWLRE